MLVAYYRVSTQRQGVSGLGLEGQRAAVRQYAKHRKLKIIAEYTEVESGRKANRPHLAAAIARARETGAVLVVAKLDRLSRDARLVLDLVASKLPLTFLDIPDAFVAALVLASPGRARAEEPKFFLNPDGTVEQRLAGVESATVKLEKRIADLEKKLAATKATVAATPTPSKIRFSVCTNGKCTMHECDDLSQVPAGATVLSGLPGLAAASCPTGPCGDACSCAAVGVAQPASASGGGGLFSRWRERRQNRSGLLGRLAGGGCASCGQ